MRWLPFQLAPDLPVEGVPRREYMARKFGTSETSLFARVAAEGRKEGLDLAFDRIEVQANTVHAHRLVGWGQRQGLEDAVVEALFVAYFTQGIHLGDKRALADVGERAGLERGPLEQYLAGDEDVEAVRRSNLQAARLGITGVPFFVLTAVDPASGSPMGRPVGLSGAQEPATLLRAFAWVMGQP